MHAGELSFEFTRFIDNEGFVPTITATAISHLGVIDMKSKGVRQMTVTEVKRCFGYADAYAYQ